MSENAIAENLLEIKTRYPGVTHIRILDDLFLVNSASMKKAVRVFGQFNFKWRAMAHIQTFIGNHVSEVKALSDSGCSELFVGVESGSPEILRKMHKTADISLIKRSLHSIMEAGIGLKAYFIFGFPEETKDDFLQTYELAKCLRSIAFDLNVEFRTGVFKFRPYHGTEVHADLVNLRGAAHDAKAVTWNRKLSSSVGRCHFNFESGNYCQEDPALVDEFISKTMALKFSPKERFA